MSSSLAIFKPARSASNLVWLFEALKLNRMAYSLTILLKLMRMGPALLPCTLDTPSICNTHVDAKLDSRVVTYFILSLDSSLGLLSGIVYLAMKSAKICAFIDGRGRYWMSNSLSFIAYFTI